MAPLGTSDDDCSSDSDDNIPLANIPRRRGSRTPIKYNEDSDKSSSEEEAEFEDDDEEEFAEEAEAYGNGDGDDQDFINDDESDDEEDDQDVDFDSDSDDDIPLSALKKSPSKRKKATASKPKAKAKGKKSKAKSTAKKKSPKKKPKRRDTSESSSTFANAIVTPSSELYGKCVKGKIIQNLLCRWWYAITWPDPSTLPDEPPTNCDSLDGFPGVYIHTSGVEVGKIVDYRDKWSCPNFNNMAKKDSSELKELLLKAIDVQREQLIESEGEGTGTQKDLQDLQKWVRKVNVNKADKEAKTVLKAAGFRF